MNIFSLESFASQGSKIYVQIFSTNFQKNHDMESHYSIDLMYTQTRFPFHFSFYRMYFMFYYFIPKFGFILL